MKKLISIAAFVTVLATFALSSCGGGKSIKTTKDSVTYAQVAYNLSQLVDEVKADTNMDFDMFVSAFTDLLDGKLKMTPDSALAFLRDYYQVRLPAESKTKGEAFMAQVEKDNPNLQKTASGILYQIENPGDENLKPTDTKDIIKVTYEGRLKDGTVFDSSIERGDTAELALGGFIPGWQEGMKLVGKGGKIKLWIPAELAYGERGNHGIGPNEPLVFEVQLIDVVPTDKK